MKKAYAYVLLILSLGLLVSGCSIQYVDETTPGGTSTLIVSLVPEKDKTPAETIAPAATELPKTTNPPAQPKPAPTDAPVVRPTEPTVQEPEETLGLNSSLPYLLRIDRADQAIYEGPGYDYAFAGTIRERGAYTIVEEKRDGEGNLWGRLKSGAGWVDVSQIRSGDYAGELISAGFADENLLLHGDYYHCAGDGQEYCVSVAIRAYGKLRDVALFAFDFSGEDYVVGADFFSLPELTAEMPLVAELAFPGDMTMYGIRFLDENGKTHIYSIYISGRNGALVLEKYEP